MDITPSPELRDCKAALREQRAELARFLQAESALRSELAAAEHRLADVEVRAEKARKDVGAGMLARAIAGARTLRDDSVHTERLLSRERFDATERCENARQAIAQFNAGAAAIRERIRAAEISVKAAASDILQAAFETQAAKVAVLHEQLMREGTILQELAPNDLYHRIDPSRTVSAETRRLLDLLPKPDPMHVSVAVLQGRGQIPRDRWAEALAKLLADEPEGASAAA